MKQYIKTYEQFSNTHTGVNKGNLLTEGFMDSLNPIKAIWNKIVNKVKEYSNQLKGSINLDYEFSFDGFRKFLNDYNSGKINIDEFISDNQNIINNLNQELNEGIIKNMLMLAIVFCLGLSLNAQISFDTNNKKVDNVIYINKSNGIELNDYGSGTMSLGFKSIKIHTIDKSLDTTKKYISVYIQF
jgi:hypothetical protein